MRRGIISLLCLSLAVCGTVGCGGNRSSEAERVSAETAQEEAEETAPLQEEAQETPPEESADPEITPPIVMDPQTPVEKGLHVAVVVKDKNKKYWKNMERNMQEAVDYLNRSRNLTDEDAVTMTFEAPDSEEDVTSQINIVDAVLAENPSVLCLAASDAESCEAQLETAAENGIPVILFDSSVESDLAQTYYGTDNVQAGALAADKLAEAMGEDGEAAVFAHENFTSTSADRVKGFRRRMKKKHPGITVGDIFYDNEEEPLEDIIRSTLESDAELEGIFCTSQAVAETALKVLKDFPERNIRLVGFDAGKIQQEAVADGREYGFVAQDTYTMAYETIWAAVRAASSEEDVSQEQVYIPYIWIDSAGLESGENEQYLYD